MLDVVGLSKTFGSQRALDGVDFQVEPGTVHALVGQNGSGKSTLIKILAGYQRPDSGATASVDGERLELGDPAAAKRAGLHFVHQDLGLVELLSAMENVALSSGFTVGWGWRILWNAQRDRARRSLARVGAQFDVNTPVASLTAAERTEVAVARALPDSDLPARYLIFDEPTASLPRADADRFFDLVHGLAADGLGIVLVSHFIDEVLGVADQVTVLRDGVRVITVDNRTLDHDSLVSLIVGRAIAPAVSHVSDGADASQALMVRGLSGGSAAKIDLQVGAGETVGIAGLFGSGREHVNELIFGVRSRKGEVLLEGSSIPPDDPKKSMNAGLALIPADRHKGLVAGLSVAENLTLANLVDVSSKGRLNRRAERREVEHWMEHMNIQPRRPGATLSTLSGGNQQKVLLAKWLRLAPKALLMDEPTRGVDVGAKADIYAAIRRAAAERTAVVVASSDPDELSLICDRVMIMRDGVVVTELPGSASAEQINEMTL